MSVGTDPLAASAATSAGPLDLIAELGVRRVINAAGTYTFLGGALMPPDVRDAWVQAAGTYVRIDELHDAIGRRIAQAVGSEAAMVTAGTAAALTVGTAACITGSDPDRIRRLPDTRGMPDEVVIQRSHRFAYDHAVRACGVRLVEVETAVDIDAAVGPETAMLLFLNLAEGRGRVGPDEFVALGRRHGTPTFIDCAADVPPISTLETALARGFDLVAVSGGKAIGGPQNAGLLLGRADLIAASRLNSAPNSDVIGRGLKVNKETMLAMLVALERFIARDHDADRREWDRRIDAIAARLRDVPGITTDRYLPDIANRAPHLSVRWDATTIPDSIEEIAEQLRIGEPSIEVVPQFPGEHAWAANGPQDALNVAVWMLQPGEEEIVGRRLVDVLTAAADAARSGKRGR